MSDRPNWPRMKGIEWGTRQIRLNPGLKPVYQGRPIEIHHKADGSATDEDSFAIVMDAGVLVVGEVTLDMFNEALGDIGYQIVRLT